MSNFNTARIIVRNDVPTSQLTCHRPIRIFLPIDYYDSGKSYPVIYMHDGQNVFNDAEASFGTCWAVGQTVDKLQANGEIEGVIVVAIDNSPMHNGAGRYDEYSPWKMDQAFELPGRDDALYARGGDGFAYADYILHQLKPFIDDEYRTLADRANTAVVGSSMGGLISLVTQLRHQEKVGFAGVFSPAFWFNRAESFDWVERNCVEQPLSIYLDIGTAETSDDKRADFALVYLTQAQQMREVLSRKSNKITLVYQEVEGAVHNEAAWCARFPTMLRFFEKQRLSYNQTTWSCR